MIATAPPDPSPPSRARLRLWLCLLAALLLAALPAPAAPERAGPQAGPPGHGAILALPGHDTAARIETAQLRPLPPAGVLPVAPPVPRPRIVAAARPFPPLARLVGTSLVTPRARAPPPLFRTA